MKNFFKTLMIVALCGAAIGMVSCNTKQNVPIDQTTWSLSSEGISMQYRAGNYYNGKITKVNDTNLELELKSTEDGYDGYLNVIWRFER